ncbi:pyrroloquinoline quinone biosynthesis protein PqqF [Vagococcus sp. WN89Y]|uniref:pyrroloquinoline quinone biosynthesis protein PqqF n=1 Tax=Vagococcus sp. WN89Y TaxID=3457258 RepID=UPI003FCD1A99
MQTVHRRLDNGVEISLVHQPGAQQAAALWRVDAGSFHEPDAWPGLAHLLEHMLFRGSASFPDTQRLMSWVPTQGGRLNASTRLSQTAYFFEVPAQQLEPGLLRLTDMLVTPLLNPDELMSETGVIDAEYRLLQQDAEKRREAALLKTMCSDGRLARFRIGNRASFGDDTALLHQALQTFHQQHYHAGTLRLWLLGPQPLETLEALARCSAALLPPATAHVPLLAQPVSGQHQALHQAGEAALILSFLLPSTHRGALRQLETLLLDETAGGLMANLRQHHLVTALTLQAENLDVNMLWLRITFTLRDETVSAAQVETLFFRWLQATETLSAAQHAALQTFAMQRFAQLAPLDALRARAFGLPPSDDANLPALLAALTPQVMTRLWVAPNVDGDACESQGFSLMLAPLAQTDCPPSDIVFSPFAAPARPTLPALPPRTVPLAHRAGNGEIALLLRPAPATTFSDEDAWILVSRLRGLSAQAARQGGQLNLQRERGIWQLTLRGDALLMQAMLAGINHHLSSVDDNAIVQGQLALARAQATERQSSAVRRLLTQLPRELQAAVASPAQRAWQAQLTGGDEPLYQALSRLLSEFTFPVIAEAPSPALPVPGGHFFLPAQEEEKALLLFLPVDGSEPAQSQVLVQRYQPRFFHHMRVERNLGYVAECQWYRCADAEGVLVAMQSPELSPEALFSEVQAFFTHEADVATHPAARWLAQQLPQAWRGASRESVA